MQSGGTLKHAMRRRPEALLLANRQLTSVDSLESFKNLKKAELQGNFLSSLGCSVGTETRDLVCLLRSLARAQRLLGDESQSMLAWRREEQAAENLRPDELVQLSGP